MCRKQTRAVPPRFAERRRIGNPCDPRNQCRGRLTVLSHTIPFYFVLSIQVGRVRNRWDNRMLDHPICVARNFVLSNLVRQMMPYDQSFKRQLKTARFQDQHESSGRPSTLVPLPRWRIESAKLIAVLPLPASRGPALWNGFAANSANRLSPGKFPSVPIAAHASPRLP